MGIYKLEYLDNAICLRIINCEHSTLAIVFIGCIGLFIFSLPILTVLFLSIEITFGTILVFIISWLVSGYIIRLFLWNKYGEEVFVVTRNTLEKYYNYKYFKDNRQFHDFKTLDITFFFEGNAVFLNQLTLNTNYTESNRLSVIGFKIDEEIITSHKEIQILDIIDIARKFEEYLK